MRPNHCLHLRVTDEVRKPLGTREEVAEFRLWAKPGYRHGRHPCAIIRVGRSRGLGRSDASPILSREDPMPLKSPTTTPEHSGCHGEKQMFPALHALLAPRSSQGNF